MERLEGIDGAIRLLLVEDDPAAAFDLGGSLEVAAPGRYDVVHVATAAGAIERVSGGDVDVAIVDLTLPDAGGFDLLEKLASLVPGLPLLVSICAPDETVSVEALRRGAQDCIVKGRSDGHSLSRALVHAIERKRIERRLAWLALHDSLTGLPNRHAFRVRLEQALARAERNGEAVAVLYLDLDRFKEVNDSLGHAAGDAVLQAVAERVRGSIREMDSVSRLSGDEFVVLLESLPSQDAAETVARKILKALEPAVSVPGGEALVTTSLGVAYCARSRSCAADSLVRGADAAMYRAKALGRGGFEVMAGSGLPDCLDAVCGGTRLCGRHAAQAAAATASRRLASRVDAGLTP